MSNREKIRQALIQQIRKLKQQPDRQDDSQGAAKRLGTLLSTVCQQRGWSAGNLASQLNVEPELAEALLAGFLPASEIDPDLLLDISRVSGYDINDLQKHMNPNTSSGTTPPEDVFGE